MGQSEWDQKRDWWEKSRFSGAKGTPKTTKNDKGSTNETRSDPGPARNSDTSSNKYVLLGAHSGSSGKGYVTFAPRAPTSRIERVGASLRRACKATGDFIVALAERLEAQLDRLDARARRARPTTSEAHAPDRLILPTEGRSGDDSEGATASDSDVGTPLERETRLVRPATPVLCECGLPVAIYRVQRHTSVHLGGELHSLLIHPQHHAIKLPTM